MVGAILLEAHDVPSAALAAVQVALGIEAQPVIVVGASEIHGVFAGARIVAHDPAGGDVGIEECFPVPDGTFGGVAPGDPPQAQSSNSR